MNDAKFVFLRDSKSLEFAKSLGCKCPVLEFGPDAVFACDIRNDAKAEAFMRNHELEEGKFLCCIPKLRYTPYWTIPSKKRPFDPVRHARNEEMKEHDHAPLRKAIVEVIRQTDLKVLLCPEDMTQMQVGKDMLLDKLPRDVRQRVVWQPDYWLTDEAISTYIRSAGLFGNEQHSAIMCIGHGIPAIVCRWAEQTTKGFMWKDIGLGDWLFDLDDESQVEKVVPAVLQMAQNPELAQAKAEKARRFVENRQKETMAVLARELM
jgi:polysaccharide pyruvyl transferase WcaK-like protein